MPFKNSYLKIFTNNGNAMYTITADQLDGNTGFIRTNIIPNEGDAIKYYLYNEDYCQIGEGNGIVLTPVDSYPRGFKMQLQTSLEEAFLTSRAEFSPC